VRAAANDPFEEGTYTPATTGRRVFEAAGLTFGIAICTVTGLRRIVDRLEGPQ